MKKTLCFVLLSIFLFGCGAKHERTAVGAISALAVKEKSIEDIGINDRKLIKDGNLRFQTNDIEKANALIKSSVNKFGGYISEESNYNNNTEVGYDLTIRVPALKYDSLMNFILKNVKIKELNNKSTKINDVTEEFIDIQARLKIKKESEQKLTDLLKQAKNLTEVLEIQKQLTDLRADIDSTEGRMKFLAAQVDYSTINVSFYEKISYSNRFFGDFWSAIKDGWQVFLHVVTLLTYLWVVILVIVLGRWGYKYYQKYKGKK